MADPGTRKAPQTGISVNDPPQVCMSIRDIDGQKPRFFQASPVQIQSFHRDQMSGDGITRKGINYDDVYAVCRNIRYQKSAITQADSHRISRLVEIGKVTSRRSNDVGIDLVELEVVPWAGIGAQSTQF